MTPAEIVESIRAEKAALEQTASLIYEVWGRLALIADDATPAEVSIRIGQVHVAWSQLDELGVDLNLPDLKSLVTAHVVNHPMSSGADEAQSAPAAAPGDGVPATPVSVPLDAFDDDPFVREV